MDAAEAHRLALDRFTDGLGMRVFNLSTGRGSSVLEVVSTFGALCGRAIPYAISGRRRGDVPELVADAGAVARAWGRRPAGDLAAMCRAAWRFQQLDPGGYTGSARRPGITD
jgi:UDP-glucose 4-epimerase